MVRAGRYAVVDGVEYTYERFYDSSPFWLTWRSPEPAPPGFVNQGGGWRRRVLPEEIARLIEVTTTARSRDLPVIIQFVTGDQAFVEHVAQDRETRPELADLRDDKWQELVPVASLVDVVEQTVELPVPPAGSANATGPVRAGAYAIYQGVTYRCKPGPSMVRLWAGRTDPQPPGFERDQRSKAWTHYVPLEDISAFFFVRTTARWKGHPVVVLEVLGDIAHIEYWGTDIDGRPELSLQQHGVWEGWVRVETLTHVLEVPSG